MELIPKILNTYLRYECYFYISNTKDLCNAKGFIKVLPRWIQYVQIDSITMSNYISAVVVRLRSLMDISRQNGSQDLIFFFIYIYGLFIISLRSLEKMTTTFLRNNYGLSLPRSVFDVSTMEFNSTIYKYVSGTKYWNILCLVFGKENSNFDEKLYFNLRFFWKFPSHSPPEYSKDLLKKISAFFKLHAQKHEKYFDLPKSYISPSRYLEYFKQKFARSFFALRNIDMLCKLSLRPDGMYAAICSTLSDANIFLHLDGHIYFVQSSNIKQKCLVIGLDILIDYGKRNSFFDVLKSFQRTDSQPSPNQTYLTDCFFLSMFEKSFFLLFKQFSINLGLVIPISLSIEIEFFLRFLFAKVPHDMVKANSKLVLMLELFKKLDDFY